MGPEEILSAVGEADNAGQATTTRADLAEAVHRKTGLGRTDSARYVEMVLDEIFRCIVAREDVKLSSFGAFLIRAKREREGRNPKTGEEAKITARLVVTFKPSNVLRARMNGDGVVILGAGIKKGNGRSNDAGLEKTDRIARKR